jgi:phospholipid-binding lipoprotein MlaA
MPRSAAAPLLLALALAGCATATGPTDPSDPFEATNRRVLDFNMALDDRVIRPVAEAYRVALPEELRARIRLFLANLNEPVVLANNVLQGRFLDAGHTLMRFYINTTAGLVGMFDVATPAGIARRTGDFGQTLHAWGVPEGPYLMLPILGPSNPRDLVGTAVDAVGSPVGLATSAVTGTITAQLVGVGRGTVGGLDMRAEALEELDALRRESIDFYARLRSVAQQRREAEVNSALSRGIAGGEGPAPAALDDPGAPPAALIPRVTFGETPPTPPPPRR